MAPHNDGGIDNPAVTQTNGSTVRQTKEEKVGCGQKITNKINKFLENGFASIGYTVGSNPWKTIIISLICAGLCVIGILEYTVENRGEENWVSQSSDSLKHKDWVEERFPAAFRPIALMLRTSDVNGDILTKQGLLDLLKVHKRVMSLTTEYEAENGTMLPSTWNSTCYRTAGQCVPTSVLELWFYNATNINNITNDADIKTAINVKPLRSPMTGKVLVLENLVGGISKRDANGDISTASVLRINYKLQKQEVFDEGQGIFVDERGERFEEKFTTLMESSPPSYILYSFSEWAANDAASEVSQGDLQNFVIGYILVIIYLSFMLGSFSRINHKIYLAFGGIAVIGISIGISYGLGSAFQFKKTAVHDVLPFLLLGIGVDDIFVIVQNWDNVGGPKDDGKDVAEKISAAMRHAGVSILVTTVTDVCAFLVGASTILPALRSFCIFAAIGILSVFIYTITFFVALLALDAKRQQARRDACLCCIKLSEDWTPMPCSEKGYLQMFVKNIYGPAILSKPGKIIILLMTVGLLVGGGFGVAKLEQDFDQNWFLPTDSAVRQFTDNQKIFFPGNGVTSNAYTGEIDYFNEYLAMDFIVTSLETDPFVTKGSVYSWYTFYHRWLNGTQYPLNRTSLCHTNVIGCRAPSVAKFYEYLDEFLTTDDGKFFQRSINKTKPMVIQASRIEFQHILFESASDEIEGLDSVQDDIKPGTITSESNELLPFAYALDYIGWETNKVISKELIRNILLAGLCVFIVTLFLISNILTSLLVLVCVVASLVNLAGYMHFWGLTIDTVTTIIMVLAIGLTVDYSAHIGHGFMAARNGDRNARMQHALDEISPAVFHGGFSTILAFILLAASESYVFLTFFKVFFMTVMFGMFHGLFFLPVALSLIGPKPYAVHYDDDVTIGDKYKDAEPVRLEKMKTKGASDNPTYIVDP